MDTPLAFGNRIMITVRQMIRALRQVEQEEGDLPCLMRDVLGVYSTLGILKIRVLEDWDVIDAVLPPEVGIGTRVVVWE